MVLTRTRRNPTGFSSKTPASGRGRGSGVGIPPRDTRGRATEMTIQSANRAGLTVSGSGVWEGPGRGGGDAVVCAPWLSATLHPCSYAKMMACGESELMSVEGEEAVAAPAPPPEPRAPEPGVPVPEPGLDLSLSSPSESPEQPNCSPGPRKGRADRRGGARKGRQVRWCKAWPAARGRPHAHLFTALLSAPRSASAWRRSPQSLRRGCWLSPHRARSPRRRRT